MELSPEIYAWLVSIDILDDSVYDKQKDINNKINYPQYPNLPASVANFEFSQNGNIKLSETVTRQITVGNFFPKLFSKMNILMNELYGNIYKDDESLAQIVDNDQAQIKLHNWELIIQSLKNYYGISFEDDFKTLLVAGDMNSFNILFEKLYTFYCELKSRIEKEINTKLLKENKQKEIVPIYQKEKLGELPKIRFNEDIVDLDALTDDVAKLKQLNQTRSVLEFIIVAICKSMSLNSKQAAALLTDNKKYLTHILTKGLTNKNFEPVIFFYQSVLGNIDYFMKLLEINSIAYPNQISKNIELSLSTFKPGLLSKNMEVVFICSRLLSKIALECIENNLISAAWDWFISPNGGLEGCLLCFKKHNDAAEVVVTLMNNFGRFHIYELFTVYLKQFLQSDGAYFTFVSDILPTFSKLSNFCDEFEKNNLKKFFLDYILEVSRSPNLNERIKSALFLSEILVSFSIYFNSEEENYRILSIFKSLYKDNNHLVQYTSINQLFRILLVFSSERNTFVPIIYKTLIFCFIEYHHDLSIRELMLSNFSFLFKVVLSIPVGIMIEPYVKQIQYNLGKTYYFNLNDISFLFTVARHPRYNVKEAMLTLDVLGKIFYDIGKEEAMEVEAFKTNTYRGIYFNKVINSLFTMILSRYLIHEIGVEFIFKFVKMSILSFCKLDKMLSDKIYSHAIVLNVNAEEEKSKLIFEEDVILNERETKFYINFRSLTKQIIVQLILDILAINNTFINGVIKNLLVGAELRHYQVYKFYNIGLSKMLSHFGEPHNLVYYYNINIDELDIDREFVKQVELIYDKAPEPKMPAVVVEKEENNNNKKKIEKNSFIQKNKNLVKYISNKVANNNNNNSFNKNKKLAPIKKKKTSVQQSSNKKLSNFDKYSDNINYNNNPFIKNNNIQSVNTTLDFKNPSQIRHGSLNTNNTNNLSLYNLNDEQISQLRYLKEEVIERNNAKKLHPEQFYVEEHLKYSMHQKSESKKTDDNRLLPGQISNNITLLDLNDEEDRDIIILKKFIKEYEGFFKDVFKRYCGSTYKALTGKNFEAIKEISDTITVSEIVKMFKQHNVIDKEISKEDIQSIITLMNSKVFKKRSLLGGITYEEFVEDFIQISYYAFAKPPYFYRHFTIADYPEEMIKLFSAQFPENMKYYNPETILTKSEREICNGLDKQLQISNFVKLPKTHKKILVTEINFKYIVPECMYMVLGEANTICLELVDEFIKKAIKSHVLEGFLVVNEVYKARPKYPQRAYPNMGMRFLFEQEKLNVLKERKSPKRSIKNNKEQEKSKEKKEVKKFMEFKSKNIKNMKDKDVISVGTSNNIKQSFGISNTNNLYETKSIASKISRGTHRTNSKIYNFFDKKSEREFLENDD